MVVASQNSVPAFYQLRLVCQLRLTLERVIYALITELYAPVTVCLDLCIVLPLKLLFAQNTAGRILTGKAHQEHISSVLRNLYWLFVHF